MTAYASDERVKPPRGPFLGKAWLTPRNVAYGAGAAIVVLFIALGFAFRGRPMPRRPAEGVAPSKRLDARIAVAQDKLQSDPQDIGALVELGVSLFEKGKEHYVEALAALEEARQLGALDPRIFYCLGVMYQDEGLFPFALEEYKKHLRHFPEDQEVRLLAGKLYYKLGLFDESVKEFERLKLTGSDDPMVEENLGLALLSAKQPARAKASFEALQTAGGDFGRRAEYYLGQMALEAGDFSAAAERFSAASAGGDLPDVPAERLYAGLGMAMQKLGRWDEAKAAWEGALKAAPRDAKATAALREVNRRLAAAKRAADAAARKAAAQARKAKKP